MKRALASLAIGVSSVVAFVPSAFAMPMCDGGPCPHPSPRQVPVVAVKPTPIRPSVTVNYVTVQSGDTLTAIGLRVDRSWQAVGAFNRLPDPNVISAGQRLRVPPVSYQPPSGYGVVVQVSPVQQKGAPPQRSAQSNSSSQVLQSATAGGSVGGAFGNCVRSRESGGNYQVMNSSGHYGAYQFSASTWAAYGGNPSTFGNASPAEQDQVFANALARNGQSNWTPYDGCVG